VHRQHAAGLQRLHAGRRRSDAHARHRRVSADSPPDARGSRQPLVIDARSTLTLEIATGVGGARLEIDGQIAATELDTLTVGLHPRGPACRLPERKPLFACLRRRQIIVDIRGSSPRTGRARVTIMLAYHRRREPCINRGRSGARNLGGAIVSHFRGLGWNTVAVARSEETLERVRATGALALAGDAADPVLVGGDAEDGSAGVRCGGCGHQRGQRGAASGRRAIRRR